MNSLLTLQIKCRLFISRAEWSWNHRKAYRICRHFHWLPWFFLSFYLACVSVVVYSSWKMTFRVPKPLRAAQIPTDWDGYSPCPKPSTDRKVQCAVVCVEPAYSARPRIRQHPQHHRSFKSLSMMPWTAAFVFTHYERLKCILIQKRVCFLGDFQKELLSLATDGLIHFFRNPLLRELFKDWKWTKPKCWL